MSIRLDSVDLNTTIVGSNVVMLQVSLVSNLEGGNSPLGSSKNTEISYLKDPNSLRIPNVLGPLELSFGERSEKICRTRVEFKRHVRNFT